MSNPEQEPVWLLLVFTLPAKRASERVEVWRRLRRSGAIPFKSSGYLLPKTAANEERLQWIAGEIRKHKGEASVAHVSSIDDLPTTTLARMFIDASTKEYETIARELRRLSGRRSISRAALGRLRRRFQDIVDRDYFNAPARSRVEKMLATLETPVTVSLEKGRRKRKDYASRIWVTRPRPGVDRAASAWLIRRFIDPNATFIFAENTDDDPKAVAFDMFTGSGFSHRGNNCTFETLMSEFGIRDKKVAMIAKAVHDADLADDKFGNNDAIGVDRILIGWAHQGISNEELLRRGMEMIEGLYQAM